MEETRLPLGPERVAGPLGGGERDWLRDGEAYCEDHTPQEDGDVEG